MTPCAHRLAQVRAVEGICLLKGKFVPWKSFRTIWFGVFFYSWASQVFSLFFILSNQSMHIKGGVREGAESFPEDIDDLTGLREFWWFHKNRETLP